MLVVFWRTKRVGVGVCVCVFGQWGDNGMLEFEACVVD